MSLTAILGAIAWDPEIRNILSVLVGAGVLVGSVYLIVGTNVGLRTGLLVTLTGLFGWLATMGVIWWIYGIGMLGSGAAWRVEELNYSGQDYGALEEVTLEEAHRLSALAELPSAQELIEADLRSVLGADLDEGGSTTGQFVDALDAARDAGDTERVGDLEAAQVTQILPPELFEADADIEELDARIELLVVGQVLEVDEDLAEQYSDGLDGWELLGVSDAQRGDASATADAFLGPEGRGLFESASGYQLRDVFSLGGKPRRDGDESLLERAVHKAASMVTVRHPTHYAVVQIQPVVEVEVAPGEAPPTPDIDEDAGVISLVLIRDLGDERFPAFMLTVLATALFALFAVTLHRRDALVAEAASR